MRANNVLGIIQSQSYDSAVHELTSVRAMGSVPFCCRYRFVDFPLSNMVNAGISQVGIVTKDNYQSLMDHTGSGKPWDLARKREGLFLLPPFNTAQSSTVPNRSSRLESLFSVLDFLKKARQEYVVITDANSVYNFDFGDLFKFHTEHDADITIAYNHGKPPMIKDLMNLKFDGEERVVDCAVSAQTELYEEDIDYCFNIFVMRKSLLEYLLNSAIAHNATSFSNDIIQANVRNLKIFGYRIPGFARMVDSLQTYYNINMLMLNPENREHLFNPENPISTKIGDKVPTHYGSHCKVANSLLADGCVIEGSVENSILFRGVKVEKGAVVKNAILMQGTVIGADSSVNSIIADKNVTITEGRNLSGDPSYPIYFAKKITV